MQNLDKVETQINFVKVILFALYNFDKVGKEKEQSKS